MLSERSQIVIVWWSLVFATMFGAVLGLLLHMIPPPDADMSADEVQNWYREHGGEIKVGATLASYCSAFLVPLWAVIAIQISRQERGRPIWSAMAFAGGILMSLFLVLPPIFFGVAAFTPNRDAEITAVMHELGTLTLVTTDQFYIFNWIAVAVICLLPNRAPHSPFPRWFGYFTAWTAMMFEFGALAFLTKTGPFSWNGLFVWWSPLVCFSSWVLIMSILLLRSLRLQLHDAKAAELLRAAAERDDAAMAEPERRAVTASHGAAED